jgi:hypothetical protein
MIAVRTAQLVRSFPVADPEEAAAELEVMVGEPEEGLLVKEGAFSV